MKRIKSVFRHRFGPVAMVISLVVAISFVTRLVLMIRAWPFMEVKVFTIPLIFLIGAFFDLVVGLFFAIPAAFYCWVMKDSWYRAKWNRVFLYSFFTLLMIILLMNAVSEIAFWEEFNVRYNFIAVDYLIYTAEVLGNIWESYNMPLILAGVLLVAAAVIFIIRRQIVASQQVIMRFGKRSLWLATILIPGAAGYFFVDNSFKNISSNTYVNQLAGNGIYEFGSAFWNNEIDYRQFYPVANEEKNISLLKKMLAGPGITFTNDSLSIERRIQCDSAERKMNVVLISVESLSGDYLKYFGNTENITPYLDSLVDKSLFFENFYASGTRTVRGLEALSLAIPPTPGQSIVRRPDNENLFSLGNVLKGKGYDVRYIYGGNSYFDNMGYFFSNNGYEVIDERDIPKEQIHHKTIWGVADEDLFAKSLEECDKSYSSGKLFFNHIMTVSNHRPYTYPEGRIDIPPSSRSIQGAVKYTDYSINSFLKMAQAKPWFLNTIFVIVSDHCSRSAGKTNLPVNRYHIPCLVYAPGLIEPRIEKKLTSQIDLAPTILGFLNLSYTSRFMGRDILKIPERRERVFISTYQLMGYLSSDTLTILSPQKMITTFKVNRETGESVNIPTNENLSAEAIAWYQTAGFLFHSGRYNYPKK